MKNDVLTAENRAAVIQTLMDLILDEGVPANVRVAAARLYLAQFEEPVDADVDELVVIDETPFKTV